jgi:uncharacterized protein (TIGR02466 family)
MFKFETPIYQTSFCYSKRDSLIEQITRYHDEQRIHKPESWPEDVHTTFLYKQGERYNNPDKYLNCLNFFKDARIPLDLVSEMNGLVDVYISEMGLSSLGQFYIGEMWYNAYKTGQHQQRHIHANGDDLYFSGIYYMKFDPLEHSSTRMFNPAYNIDFDKLPSTPPFVYDPPIQENDVVIFPADVQHEVLAQQSDCLRITIAFNVYLNL